MTGPHFLKTLKRRGLGFRFVFSISLLLIITLGATALYFTRSQEQLLLGSLNQRANAVGQFLAMISPEAIYAFDITTLDRYVRQVSEDEDILLAQILDTRGRALTTFAPEGMSRERISQITQDELMDPGLSQLRQPILDEGERLGEVLVVVDQRRVETLIQHNLRRQLWIYGGIILFLAGVIFGVFLRYVLSPVLRLLDGVNQVSQGNYQLQLPVKGNDELTDLTDCFNNMAAEICNDHAELHHTNQVLAQEVEQRRRAEQGMRLNASVFTSSHEGITITDTSGCIIDVNQAFSDITGYSREEAIGQNPRILNSGRHDKDFYQAMWHSLAEQGHWSGEIWNKHKNGSLIAELLTISAVRNDEGGVGHYVAIFSDISKQKAHEAQLERAAHYDLLTGLPNRMLLSDRLHQAMVQTRRRGRTMALAYLDLDGFKEVNDTYGHSVGDKLLRTVSDRLKQNLREADSIGRLGGDEFVALLLDLDQPEDCVPLMHRLLSAASEPVEVAEGKLNVSVSIGVSFYPQAEEVDEGQLMRQADQAMYQAKLSGKNGFNLFDPETEYSLRGQQESLQRLALALEQGEFELYYQPKVNLRTGTLVGVEALIRWNHPEQGLQMPGSFLPHLEGHPLAIRLGEWVIEQALLQLQQWRGSPLQVPISVNVDAFHLQHADFPQRLRLLLDSYPGIEPGMLQLELLETSTIQDILQVSQLMRECAELGVEFALDDFGTGYSSLIYLKHLPARQLKIDQTFVCNMLDDSEDLAIVEGVLGLAAAFKLDVIAEGVETTEHGNLLLQLGCEQAQGFGIARPMPAGQLPEWQKQWRPDPAWAHLHPVGREHLSALLALVEHRTWIAGVKACVIRHCKEPPPLDPHQCRFGQWLDREGQEGFATSLREEGIYQLHEQIHHRAEAILELQARGKSAQAQAQLSELEAMRDDLSRRFNRIVS